jgi:pyruvate/2-oxoglutarate dehydrogenase complex dihydrolipoamide dehydrogenase (E3) component
MLRNLSLTTKRLPKGDGVYNLVVIGAGTAGLVTAAGTAGLGGRVAIIERDTMGGDCLNFGCVPSKALISSARILHSIRRAADWGITAPLADPDFTRIFERMRERRKDIAPHDSQERFESLGVDVFRGEAHFVSPREVEVDGLRLRASNFVIATGSRASKPRIKGIDHIRFFTNKTIFDKLKSMPARLLILGGGPIGCELAQTFTRFGVHVTLVQRGPRLLPREDPDVSYFLLEALKKEGIVVHTNSEVSSLASSGDGILANIKETELSCEGEFDTLLIAAGRTANIEELHLDAAGVKTDEKGVQVNDFLQTSQAHIYAAGDVTGRFLFTHVADYQARIVVRNVLMPIQPLRQKVNYSGLPWCTFTDPEIARVGLSEEEAKQSSIEYDVYQEKMSDIDRAIVENATAGFVKILTARGSDKILGAAIVAQHAGELLQPLVLAMHARLGLSKVAATIHPYPTFVEVERKAGDAYHKTKLTPFARKIFGWLYRRQLQKVY